LDWQKNFKTKVEQAFSFIRKLVFEAQKVKKSLNRSKKFFLQMGSYGFKRFYADFKMGLFTFVASSYKLMAKKQF
jgi:hypothetical protein